jgi:hypothetical protein
MGRFIAWAFMLVWSVATARDTRSRLYEMQSEHELMWTTLSDLARMYPDHPAGQSADRVLNRVTDLYTRDNTGK